MHKVERWLFSAVLLACYVYRIATLQSYFVVSYVLAIYTMQVLLRYFTPLGLPDIEDEEEDQYDSTPLPANLSSTPTTQRRSPPPALHVRNQRLGELDLRAPHRHSDHFLPYIRPASLLALPAELLRHGHHHDLPALHSPHAEVRLQLDRLHKKMIA